jgi:hypothetical protein
MRKHEVNYHEKTNIIEFTSKFCTHSRKIETKTTKTSNKEKNISFEKKSFLNQSDHSKFDDSIMNSRNSKKIVIKILFRKKVSFDQLVDQSSNSLFRKNKKSTNLVKKKKTFNTIRDFRLNLNELEISNSKEKMSEMNIAMIETSAFNMRSKRNNVNLLSVILKDVEKHLEKHSKSNIVIRNVLLSKYHEFLNVFDKKAFNILASHRSYDHKIMLKKNVVSDYTSLYKMFEEKLKIIKKYLEDNLKKRFIIVSRFSFVSSVMFMKKANESLKFCVNYKKLNQLNKKNRYSLSLIEKTFAHLRKIKYFIKLDIRQTFHRVRITNAEFEDFTTFKIRFETYKYRVLSFELWNEFATYQHYINNVFFDFLNDFVFAYINDILIYSNSKKST